MDSQKKYSPKFSFECYSPKTPEAIANLQKAQLELAKLNPDFFSVTYGAAGSTRNMTLETVLDIRKKTGIESVPHISCVGNWNDEIKVCVSNKSIEDGILKKRLNSTKKFEIKATPTIYINGKKYDGDLTFEALKLKLDSLIN